MGVGVRLWSLDGGYSQFTASPRCQLPAPRCHCCSEMQCASEGSGPGPSVGTELRGVSPLYGLIVHHLSSQLRCRRPSEPSLLRLPQPGDCVWPPSEQSPGHLWGLGQASALCLPISPSPSEPGPDGPTPRPL
jgi:hypothetical protein